MAKNDFHHTLLNPQPTLIECYALALGRYQVTGNGCVIQPNDVLLVILKNSHNLHMRLQVEKVRHLINPLGQWLAVCKNPKFKELALHNWQVNCDSCDKQLDFEFAINITLGKAVQAQAAEARIAELGWHNGVVRRPYRNDQEA